MSGCRVAIAGCTGSIGTQTLDVLAAEPERFELTALGASGRQLEPLVGQAVDAAPRWWPSIRRPGRRARRRCSPSARSGPVPAPWPAWPPRPTWCVNGVVGFAGLPVTLATLEAGRRLALANKESLIAAGPVVQRARRTPGAELVPVDSEHGAIHQCLRANDNPARVGRTRAHRQRGTVPGPHAPTSSSQVTVDDALAHPTWSMGPKITVDSSTLMNKGLEVIEAHELFGAPAGDDGVGIGFDQIEVVVHPQSIVHSMVEFTDGATIAQLSQPDMRLPIGYALAYPDRIDHPVRRHRLDRRSGASTSSPPTSTPSPAWAWPTRPAAPGAPPRRGSTPPTRWRWRPSSTAASAGPRSPRS